MQIERCDNRFFVNVWRIRICFGITTFNRLLEVELLECSYGLITIFGIRLLCLFFNFNIDVT